MSFEFTVIEDAATPMLQALMRNIEDMEKVDRKVLDIGVLMVELARALVPVLTGYLQSTIFFNVAGPGDYRFGATAYYAFFVERGTRFMIARPYIQPALEAFMADILQAVLEGIMLI